MRIENKFSIFHVFPFLCIYEDSHLPQIRWEMVSAPSEARNR